MYATINTQTPDDSVDFITNTADLRTPFGPGGPPPPPPPTLNNRTPPIDPPDSVSGCKAKNIFLLQIDLINNITWTAPTTGDAPVQYQIYRDEELTELVATVPANGPLQYYDHSRQPNVIYSYYIVSVDANGNVSTANSVTVTQACS
jgi:hypothetical protein